MLNKIRIDFGKKTLLFTRKGKKKANIGDEGMVAVNMDVITADGKKWDAIGIFDEMSSGEHCGTLFFTDDSVLDAQELQKAGHKAEDIFPYKYKYRKQLDCFEDFHVDEETGWSR